MANKQIIVDINNTLIYIRVLNKQIIVTSIIHLPI